SQLIAQDGHIAAFFHDGKPTDAFRAGRYDLSTQNLPVLGKLLKLTTLSRSPFRSYVYFIALKTFTNLGWGTPVPILFRDSEFKIVNLRANGAFAVRVANPKVFLTTIVGTQGMETTFAAQEYLRKIIVARLAETLPAVLTTIVDLPRHYGEVAVRVKKAVHDDFDQYGLELVDLLIEAITVPEEVQQAINRAAGTRAVGMDELDRYERTARSDALRDAAKQPGGGAPNGLTAGLGIAAGMQVARDVLATPPSAGASAAGAAKLTMDEIRAKLRDLKSLADEGLITQEDFEAKKRRLLDQL
ncbi:MAG: SPFH domain-containing protein, partial [Planctomycetia bacterium]|nr:SPFH domain-containing protein [Planctomycetia bacterium]